MFGQNTDKIAWTSCYWIIKCTIILYRNSNKCTIVDEEYEEDDDHEPPKALTRVGDMKNAVKEMNSNEETSNGDGYSDDQDQE